MENRRSIEHLFSKFLDNQCTPREVAALMHYFGQETSEAVLREKILDEIRKESPVRTQDQLAADEVYQSLIAQIRKDRGRTMHLPLFLRYAAIWLLLLVSAGIGGYFFFLKKEKSVGMIHMQAAPGEHKEVKLPDGSVILLNAGSSLHYPETFYGNERTVVLRGEAFFSVTRDEHKPFIIRTGELLTKVLGTSFNIRAYPEDSSIAVAVVSGKVEVKSGRSSERVELERLDQVVYRKSDDRLVRSNGVDVGILTGWREGKFHFRGQTFAEVARTLERRYDAHIQFDKKLADCPVHADFSDTQPLEAILKMLAASMNGNLQNKKDREYELSGEGCL